MAKADRLLYILNLLRSRRNLNAGRLAEECGVTERSIYRDIISLSEANIPIYYDKGYKMASGNFLPPLNLTAEEYQSLRMSLESTPLRVSSAHSEVLGKVKAKIEAGLSDSVNEKRRRLPDLTHVDIVTTQEISKARKYYSVVEKALNDDHCLDLVYNSIQSGKSRRLVEPQFIIFRGRAFYFVAYCRSRKALRTFRMDRVISMAMSNDNSRSRPTVRPQDYFAGSWEIYSGNPVEVEVRFTGSAARVISFGHHHESETIEKIGEDELIYRVTVNGLEEIKRWILGFGAEATVLKPDELRRDLGQIGEYFLGKYNS